MERVEEIKGGELRQSQNLGKMPRFSHLLAILDFQLQFLFASTGFVLYMLDRPFLERSGARPILNGSTFYSIRTETIRLGAKLGCQHRARVQM
jgi:hypothetical protein